MVKVNEGLDSCTVGFVPHALRNTQIVQQNKHTIGQVTFLFNKAEKKYLVFKSYYNCGMAGIALLQMIPHDEA